ncbi:MAG: cyanophycinase [Candidatus Acidiferrales bacterium]
MHCSLRVSVLRFANRTFVVGLIGALIGATASVSSPLRAARATDAPPYRYIRIGSPNNIHASARPGYALIGGGQDLDDAFTWLCQRSGGGDFLIIRASGTDAYNPYIQSLCHVNSVATLIIPNRSAANDPFVVQTIRAASAIFIAGGDQANYINFWSGTPVQRAVNDAIQNGIPIGGTSAGLAILGQFAYSAQHDASDGPDLHSLAALANPFDPQVVVVRDFLHIPALQDVITDSHFHARDRLGRLLVFMARILEASDARKIHAIGIDQHTAFLLDADGNGVVAGAAAVHFFAAAYKPSACRPGVPLTFDKISVRKLVAGEKFNAIRWNGSGISYTLSVKAGVLSSTQPGGMIY